VEEINKGALLNSSYFKVVQHLEKTNFILTFDVSNVEYDYDYYIWFERDRTDLERNPSKKKCLLKFKTLEDEK